MPTISVVIPAYNAERTVLETIHSVQQQTFSDWEIIVINDGSTDQTLDLLQTINDPRVQIFTYPNEGLSVARNRGISHATGEFISFLDADDLWTADKLELQLSALRQNPEAGVAYSWCYCTDEKGEIFAFTDSEIYFTGNVYPQLLLKNFIVNGSNCLIRRQAVESVGNFDPTVAGSADWDYWLRLARNWHFIVVPKPQVFYRISSNSMSSNVEFMKRCSVTVIEKAFQSAPPELQSLKNQSLAYNYRYLANISLAQISKGTESKQAAEMLWQAIRLYPPILRESWQQGGWTRDLLIKVLLLRLIPANLGMYLIRFSQKIRAHRYSRFQQS